MPLLSFGQPANGIMQMAYVVKDIRQEMMEWVTKLRVGPWFLLEHFTGEHPVYRGRKSTADVAIAMSFAGHMNIELIQPNDSNPSVYKESIDAHGYGFHHWGVASADVDADIKLYEAMGMEVAFRAGVPTGGDVAYMDTHGRMPGFVELIATNPLMERAFAHFYGAALGWDGSNPVRPFM
ncbi:MAG TPA: VOC family protein [Steroidobacteraceae bacterium]|nr:VOC family protein [Steroidobacteraceae bacterium]